MDNSSTNDLVEAAIVLGEESVAELPAAPVGDLCSSCGAPCDQDDPFCSACGKSREAIAESVVSEVVALKTIRCENCGSELTCHLEQRSYVCPFCDSPYVVEFSRDQTDRQPPEFVIGFGITPEQAQAKFSEWLGRNAWFRPGDLRLAQVAEKMQGVYLSFWSFSMLARSEWQASIGENWQRTETYTTRVNGKMVTRTRTVTETEWWPLAGKHHRYYRGYLVSGSCGLPQNQADRIKPFRLEALHRYQPYYLAGWMSEEYSIDRQEALERSRQEFSRRIHTHVRELMPGDHHREVRVRTEFSEAQSDLILLPIYVLSYRYGDRLFRFLVNGQTGKIAGDKPISKTRIASAVGGGLLAFALAILLFYLLNR